MKRLLVLALFVAGCSGKVAAAEAVDTTTPVSLATPVRGPIARPIRGTGVVRLKSELGLGFKVGGLVQSVLVEEGATVKRGQVLARLDPTEVEAGLRQAREAKTKADRDLERVKRLHATGAIAIAEVENAQTGSDIAGAAMSGAAFLAERSAILAPDDGRIDRRLVEPGQVVAPGQPIVQMSGRSRGGVVRIGVTDREALRARVDDVATVTLDAKPGEPVLGKVSRVATVATPGTGTFDVEILLDDAGAVILSGLTAKVEIAHAENGLVAVPIGAIVEGKGEDAAVYTVVDAHARRVPVKIAFLDRDRAVLRELVAPSIVAAGASRLVDGAPVRIVN